jgi:predicted TIM-barrel fold metal-dependent hydrolase
MIIDAHCHAWDRWPYDPPVPDPETRGRLGQLVYEMDAAGVNQALLVCAQIRDNLNNNEDVARAAQATPGRIHLVADLDCEWSPTYHTPGAAARLRTMAQHLPLAGFTHYLRREEDGAWLDSAEGGEVFETAAELGLLASIACYPHQQPAVRAAARLSPGVPFLVHHMGLVQSGLLSAEENLRQVLESAEVENIFVKVSGFGYPAKQGWEYPYPASQETLRAIYTAYGPRRLLWGSDYPVVNYYMTYRQSLEVLRTHCAFIPAEEKGWILGDNLARLLKRE